MKRKQYFGEYYKTYGYFMPSKCTLELNSKDYRNLSLLALVSLITLVFMSWR